MPAPSTTGVNMGYPSTVDTGGVPPLFIGTEIAAEAGTANTVLSSAVVYLYQFDLYASTIITGVKWFVGTTATGHCNMGIYTSVGNIVSGSDTGAIANVISTTMSQTYANAIPLAPGSYYIAISCDNGTDTFTVITSPGANSQFSRVRIATNALSAGALPLTTGTITLGGGKKMPACQLVTSGGI